MSDEGLRQGPVPPAQALAFSFALIPIASLALPLSLFVPPLYARELGLGVGVVGTVFTLARLWDFVTDIAMGWAIDRFPSRWGRRKHWIALSLPIVMLAGWRIYMPPPDAGVLYLTGWMFVLYVGYTLLLITHYAWGSELTADKVHRARLYGWREAFLVGGILLSVLLPAIAEQAGGADLRSQVTTVGLILLATLPVAVAVMLWVLPDEGPSAAPPPDMLRRAWAALRERPSFRLPLVLDFLTGLAQGILGAVFIFAATYVYGLGDVGALLLLVYFAVGLFALPVWVRLLRRFEPERLLAAALVWQIAFGLAYFAVPAGSFVALALVVALNGVAFGPPLFVVRTLMAGAIDETATADAPAIRSTGFALLTMSNKLSGALAVGLAFGALALGGFDTAAAEAGGTELDATARNVLLAVFALGPAIMSAAALAVLASHRRGVSRA